MNEIVARGCRLEPIGSYLKALGVLRLIAEQADHDAAGWWRGEVFVLATALSDDELVDFFLDRYEPTPLVAPWNGRSGFRPEDDRPASGQLLRAFEQTTEPRCEQLRQTIAAGRAVHSRMTALGLDPKKDKAAWVEASRATFPDTAVRWLDAVAVLTGDGEVEFPVVLGGSGGVLGSLDLSGNYLDHLSACLPLGIRKRPVPRALTADRLRTALLAEGRPPMVSAAAGQFDPGAAGGINSSPLGDAGGLVNPWDFVLQLEGALLFASAAARRLATDPGWAASPFMVAGSAIGFAGQAEREKLRGELWAPVWRRPTGLAELDRFIGEGRASWAGRQARTGLDFARAATSLGVDRGVEQFVRHVFAERLGMSLIAVPVGRVRVHEPPQVPVLAQLERWLSIVRRVGQVPTSISAALRQVDAAQFDVARIGGPAPLQVVLARTAELEACIARSGTVMNKLSRPVTGLDARVWLPLLDDGSPEFRLAVAVGLQSDRWLPSAADADRRTSRFACYVRWVQLTANGRSVEWSTNGRTPVGLVARPLHESLLRVLLRRSGDAIAGRTSTPDSDGSTEVVVPQRGCRTAFERRTPAALADVVALTQGDVDEARLARLIAAVALLDPAPVPRAASETSAFALVPPALAVLAPFFAGWPLQRYTTDGAEATVQLLIDPGWSRLLSAGAIGEVIRQALHRLAVAGFEPAARSADRIASCVEPALLSAALAVPISRWSAQRCLQMTGANDPPHEASTEAEEVPVP